MRYEARRYVPVESIEMFVGNDFYSSADRSVIIKYI